MPRPQLAGHLSSVKARTALLATATVALVLVLAIAALSFGVERALTMRLQAQARDQVDLVVDRLAAGASYEEALQPNRDATPVDGVVPPQVEILTTEGAPVTGSGFFTIPGVASDEASGGVSTTGFPWAPTVRVGRTNLAVAQRSIEVGNQQLLVVAASPVAGIAASANTFIGAAAAGLPLVIGLVWLITWTTTGRALRPIDQLRANVERFSVERMDQRAKVPDTDDEVARLAVTMNGMLDRLEAAAGRQREFVSDAAHELRSPIASLQTELEVSLLHPDSRAWPAVARDALGDVHRLTALVDTLLTLAMLDEGRQDWPRVAVPLSNLVLDAVARVHAVAVDVEVRDDIMVLGRRADLASLVNNLVDNAARHARHRVTVRAVCNLKQVHLTVDDDGPGVPVEDRDRIFERFTRLDQDRARRSGGAGLGLAVVSRVAQSLGGSTAVTESPMGGARFEVELPAAQRMKDPTAEPV